MRLAIAAVLAVAAVAAASASDNAAELAQSLQRKYDTIRDFSADFVQSYQSGVLRKQTTERGQVLIKKPGKMRWEYTSPEKHLFVSDGIKIYSYVPADRQVVVGTMPQDDRASTPILFLAGKGNITRDFTAAIGQVPAGSAPDSVALKLVPKTAQPDYDWLLLVVDRQSLTLRGLVTTDAQGGTSSITFANLKENVNPADKQFAFNIPRGVDVINDSSR